MVRVVNVTRQTVLGERVEVADTFVKRFCGLMFREELAAGTGLVLDPCNSIHMFFMRFAIDAAFIDAEGSVVGLCHDIKPWRVSSIYSRAVRTVEVPVGTLKASFTEVGDRLSIEPVTVDEEAVSLSSPRPK